MFQQVGSFIHEYIHTVLRLSAKISYVDFCIVAYTGGFLHRCLYWR